MSTKDPRQLTGPAYLRTRDQISALEVVNGKKARFNDSDAASANNEFIEQWLGEAYTSGLRATLPAGTLYTAEKILINPTAALSIEGVPGLSIIKGADDTGFAQADRPVLEIDGLTDLPRLFMRGIKIDNSLRTFNAAQQSGTALSLKRMSDFDIWGFHAVGAHFYGSDTGTSKGDSGATVQECHRGRFWYPILERQPDLGIYVTGGSDTDLGDQDEADIEVYAPYFYRCDMALASKRQARRVKVIGGLVEECRVGIGLIETSFQAGVEMTVIGTNFKRIGGRALWAQGNVILDARGVVIEDFGFDYLDVSTGVLPYAIRLEGGSRARIEARIRQRGWSGAGLRACELDESTINSVDYIPDQVRLDLMVEGVGIGVYEETDGAITGTIGGGSYDLKVDSGVTTPVTMATGSTSRAVVRKHDGTTVFHKGTRSWEETKVTPATAPTMAFTSPGNSSFTYTNQKLEIIETETTIKGRCQMTFTPTIGTGTGSLRVVLTSSLPEAWDSDPAIALANISNIGANWLPPVGATGLVAYTTSNGFGFRWIIPGSTAVIADYTHVTNAAAHELVFAFEMFL